MLDEMPKLGDVRTHPASQSALESQSPSHKPNGYLRLGDPSLATCRSGIRS